MNACVEFAVYVLNIYSGALEKQYGGILIIQAVDREKT
jgi:hypothetical protein